MNVYFTTSPIHIGQTLKLVTYNEPKLYKTKPNQTNETAITENLEHLLLPIIFPAMKLTSPDQGSV